MRSKTNILPLASMQSMRPSSKLFRLIKQSITRRKYQLEHLLYRYSYRFLYSRSVLLRSYGRACRMLGNVSANLSGLNTRALGAGKTCNQVHLSVPVIFIVGPPRSGTTWLWGLLSSHPDVTSITKDMLGIGTSFNPDGSRRTSETGVFLSSMDDGEIIRCFATAKGNAKYVIEKTPHHSFHMKRIKRLFPDSFIVCMRRNVYDILTSMTHFFPQMSFKDLIEELQHYLSVIEDSEDLVDAYVDYELLINDTENILGSLFEKLDLDDSPLKEIVALNNRRTLLHERSDAFRKGVVGDYRNQLSPCELQQVDLFRWPERWVRYKSE